MGIVEPENDFNHDFHVSFTKDEMASGKVYYNYGPSGHASVFFKAQGLGILISRPCTQEQGRRRFTQPAGL